MLDTKIEVGTLIWRGIHAHIKGPGLDQFACVRTERGSWMFKTDSGRGHFTNELVAFSGQNRWGLVCFIDEPPEGPWTHFEVLRVNKNGKSVQVRAACGDPGELFKQYDPMVGAPRLHPVFAKLRDKQTRD